MVISTRSNTAKPTGCVDGGQRYAPRGGCPGVVEEQVRFRCRRRPPGGGRPISKFIGVAEVAGQLVVRHMQIDPATRPNVAAPGCTGCLHFELARRRASLIQMKPSPGSTAGQLLTSLAKRLAPTWKTRISAGDPFCNKRARVSSASSSRRARRRCAPEGQQKTSSSFVVVQPGRWRYA
jgi:hypothetical protein